MSDVANKEKEIECKNMNKFERDEDCSMYGQLFMSLLCVLLPIDCLAL